MSLNNDLKLPSIISVEDKQEMEKVALSLYYYLKADKRKTDGLINTNYIRSGLLKNDFLLIPENKKFIQYVYSLDEIRANFIVHFEKKMYIEFYQRVMSDMEKIFDEENYYKEIEKQYSVMYKNGEKLAKSDYVKNGIVGNVLQEGGYEVLEGLLNCIFMKEKIQKLQNKDLNKNFEEKYPEDLLNQIKRKYCMYLYLITEKANIFREFFQLLKYLPEEIIPSDKKQILENTSDFKIFTKNYSVVQIYNSLEEDKSILMNTYYRVCHSKPEDLYGRTIASELKHPYLKEIEEQNTELAKSVNMDKIFVIGLPNLWGIRSSRFLTPCLQKNK